VKAYSVTGRLQNEKKKCNVGKTTAATKKDRKKCNNVQNGK
jgi:hypothetical protein